MCPSDSTSLSMLYRDGEAAESQNSVRTTLIFLMFDLIYELTFFKKEELKLCNRFVLNSYSKL